ncbi:protein kinase domain-containing protein [Streptomyces sp. GC420]|uniref:serine/threonine-protein kinase n=1 Tax=Streptomyces sp. GC420 TaxID=2697568 RepID=UPI001414ED86|nr:serine/threonine-protein kinase [Streptomyces sp. GC420]NBM18289.1 PQQ-binding-like beta-propeller repeat protein [Streptomyces sp. GC420]
MSLREDDPRSVGGHRIEARIGTGGMGVVYLARSASGRAVAVKVVHARFADNAEFRARFRQEIAAARRVSGAFTAPVVDADPDAERPWMATAYVPGRTLAERVTESGPLDWPALHRLGTELAEALREIHRAEVVHRDLKPSNVLLLDEEGDDGAVRVIDFGISRAASSDVRTQTGMVMGSPPFMAPEQFSRPREVGPAVDVFSLGALLVYAATGRSPFEADNAYVAAYNTVHSEPELGGLPEPARRLVTACLAKDPAARPTPGEVLEALAKLPGAPARTRDSGDPGSPGAAGSRDERGNAGAPPLPPGAGATVLSESAGRRVGHRRWVAIAAALLLGAAGTTAAVLSLGPTNDAVPRTVTGSTTRTTPAGWQPWRTTLGRDDEVRAGPSLSPSCTPDALGVFCSTPEAALLRLSPTTGRVDWTRPMKDRGVLGPAVSRPVVHDGLVYVRSADAARGVDAFDGRTGKRLWHLDGPVAEFSYLSGVLVARLDEFGASKSADYAAYDPRTGEQVWRRELASASPSPFHAGAEGMLYADLRGGSGPIARIDARTGRTLGTVTAPEGDLWLATVHDGTAYYARWEDGTGVSAAFFIQDLETGRTRRIDFPWSVEPEAPPLVHGDTMYLFDYGNEALLALDLKRGKPLWTSSRELRVFGEPALHDGRLYVNMPDTSVLALDPRTGEEIGRTDPPFDTAGRSFEELSPSPVPPLPAKGVLYGVNDLGVFSVADVS